MEITYYVVCDETSRGKRSLGTSCLPQNDAEDPTDPTDLPTDPKDRPIE